MNAGLLANYVTCSCYKTQLMYTIQNPKMVYACHCTICIKENLNNRTRYFTKCPIIWVNIKDFFITNEFTNDVTDIGLSEESNKMNKIKWKKTGLFSKRGYCKFCDETLLLIYFSYLPFLRSIYICNNNATPYVDLHCKNKNLRLTNKSFNSYNSYLHLLIHPFLNYEKI